MPTLLLKSGRVICPAQNLDAIADLWLADGEIVGIGPQPHLRADDTLNCNGLIVSPGLIDMHVHLREPGREEDETIATGTAAAVAGGVTAVACMPNGFCLERELYGGRLSQYSRLSGNSGEIPGL